MQVIKSLDDASRIEARGAVVEVTSIAQYRPQLTAQTGFHQHVDVLGVAIRVVQSVDIYREIQSHFNKRKKYRSFTPSIATVERMRLVRLSIL